MQPGFEGGFNGIFCTLQGGGGGERVQAFVVVFSSGDTHVKFTRVTRDMSLHSNYSQAMNKPTPLSKSGEVVCSVEMCLQSLCICVQLQIVPECTVYVCDMFLGMLTYVGQDT